MPMRRAVSLAVPLLAFAVVAAWPDWSPAYDDAYITLTSARALWTGQIPAYPDAAPLHGITSPVHVALVALLVLLAPPLYALQLSQAIGAALYAAGIWQIGRPLSLLPRLAVLVVGLAAGTVWHQLTNGLETGLAMACGAWIVVGVRERAGWLPLLLGTAPYVRPEYWPVVALVALVPGGWRERLRLLALTAAAAAPWSLWLLAQIGQPVASSMQAKLWMEAARTPSPDARVHMLLLAAGLFAVACGPLVCGLVALRHERAGRLVLAGLVIVTAGYAATQPALLVEYHAQRYVYPLVPFALAGFVLWLQRAPDAPRRVGLVLVLAYALVALPRNAAFPLAFRAHIRAELPAVARTLAALPPDAVVAVGDAGYLAYATPYRLVDIVGLKSPAAAAIHRAVTAPTQGRDIGRALDRILSAEQARALVIWQGWDGAVGFVSALRARGWTATDLRDPHTAPPLGQYRIVALTPPPRPPR